MNEYYRYLDDQINHFLSITVGFDNLLATGYHRVDGQVLSGFFARYTLLKEFQETTLRLFKASLKGELDPEVATLVINELPEYMGLPYHRALTDRQHATPLFFRTDEVAPGIITEIQCPGSAWGLCEQMHQFHCEHSHAFGAPVTFPAGLADGFSQAVKSQVEGEPHVHHLLDNASIQHGMRYFLQRTRAHGLKYFGYDKAVTPYNSNFVRSHDFVSLVHNNFAQQRLVDCEDGKLVYDLPPTALFEQKVIFTFPFWHKTRPYYSDAIRGLFPFTCLIRPDGVTLEDGDEVSLDSFARLSRRQRDYFIKYAGSDISLNWGSKGVFYASTLSQAKTTAMLDRIVSTYGQRKYWIIQRSHNHSNEVEYLTRDGEQATAKVYSKYSGFYGPSGLIGLLVMERPFYKVHGSQDTILSLCR